MAENILYGGPDESDVDSDSEGKEEELFGEEMEEINISEGKRKLSKCEICVKRPVVDSTCVAVFLCFACGMYVCVNCMPAHKSHEGMNVGRQEREREKESEKSERKGEQSEKELKKKKKHGLWTKLKRIGNTVGKKEEREIMKRDKSQKDRMKEQSENERMRIHFLDELINESKIERTQKFNDSQAVIYDRVEIKHKLAKRNCLITGICGLDNKKWVVCDYRNFCIKVFKMGNHLLERYIRFGSEPQDVTKIHVNQNSNEPNLVSSGSSDVFVTNRTKPSIQCLIAVTLPWKRQIMFVDLSGKPALKHKVKDTEKECWTIQFCDNKLFTVCSEDCLGSRFYVYIKSTDGDTLSMFDTGIYGFRVPYLAVVSGKVYLTDSYNNKVQCRNVEGQVISDITIEGSRPVGISVDPDNNVYVCAWKQDKIFKLDSDLTRYKSVLDENTNYIREPLAICYYNDKLYVSHFGSPSLSKCVTVVLL